LNITCADTSVHACSSENSRRPLVAAGLADMLLHNTTRLYNHLGPLVAPAAQIGSTERFRP